MRTRCTSCRHPDVAEIDRELLAGTSHRRVAKHYSLAASSVYRHQSKHLQPPEAEAPEVRESQDLRLGNRVEALEGDIGVHREAILTLCGAVKRLQQGRQ